MPYGGREGGSRKAAEASATCPVQPKPALTFMRRSLGDTQGRAVGSPWLPCSGVREHLTTGRAALQPSPGGQGCEQDGQ